MPYDEKPGVIDAFAFAVSMFALALLWVTVRLIWAVMNFSGIWRWVYS